MLGKSLAFAALISFSVCAGISQPSRAADQPAGESVRIGGGYTNAFKIPVKDPDTDYVAAAPFKPAGAGPFPLVILMSGCAGINDPDALMFKRISDDYGTMGVATLVLDSFAPRKDDQGVVCSDYDRLTPHRRAEDAYAAMAVAAGMPDIDPKRIFLQGFSHGAVAAIDAIDPKTAAAHNQKFAGVIAYYPYCLPNARFPVPTLVLIGDKDDWTPAAFCQGIVGEPNLKVVVYPGATHAFNVPGLDMVSLGHRLIYDDAATRDAQGQAHAFLAAHLN